MDLSNKSLPALDLRSTPRDHTDTQDTPPPTQHYVPSSSISAPFLHNSNAAQNYRNPSFDDRPPFFPTHAPHGLSPYSQAMYAEPSPLFMSQPYLTPQPIAHFQPSFIDERVNYSAAAEMMDGMAARPKKHHEKKPIPPPPPPPQKKPPEERKHKEKAPKQLAEEFNDVSPKDSHESLKSLLYDTLQQEVSALETLRKQIGQFAVITQNAKRYCNMDMMNPILAQQGMLNVVGPGPIPIPMAHLQPLRPLHRPIPRRMPPQNHYRGPPPPPAHQANYPRMMMRQQFRPPHHPANSPGDPMNIAFHTLYDVENRLRHCEKAVSHKIEEFEKQMKGGGREGGPGGQRRDLKDGKAAQGGQNRNRKLGERNEAKEIQNMAYRTLQDIEKRLKVNERDVERVAGRGERERNEKKRPPPLKRDIAIQTPDHSARRPGKPHSRNKNPISAPESLEGLSHRLETEMLESRFAKKIILLLYSHLRKLARGALQKGKEGNDMTNYKSIMERNGVVFSVPTENPDDCDELAINVELKIPMNMLEEELTEARRKRGDSLTRCRRKCCKKKHHHHKSHKKCDGYLSEPEGGGRKSRRDEEEGSGRCEKKRHCSAPNKGRRGLSSEEEDLEVIEARARRIKEYLDSSTMEREKECKENDEKEAKIVCCDGGEELEENLCERMEEERVCEVDKEEKEMFEEDCGERRNLSHEVENVVVENASKRDRECEGEDQKETNHHHHHHHHQNNKEKNHHHHPHHIHRGLDCLEACEWDTDMCNPLGQNLQNVSTPDQRGRRVSWPKHAYLAKHQHHGTFWPIWTESPYCRLAETMEDVPTMERECTTDETEWEEEGKRRHRRWSEMEGAQGSHFTSVSEARNDLYKDKSMECPTIMCEPTEEQRQCNRGLGLDGGEEKECGGEGVCGEGGENATIDCQPEDLSINGSAPYHMELRMAGPFYPETITRVMAPQAGGGGGAGVFEGYEGEDCVVHSPHGCTKARLVQDGLQFKYY